MHSDREALLFVLVCLLFTDCNTCNIFQNKHGSWRLTEYFIKFLKEGSYHWSQEPRDEPYVLSDYDFIIVGAGSAGCVLANRLTEVSKWKVLLIEAGRPENFVMDIPVVAFWLPFSDANWGYRTEPVPNSCLGMEDRRCLYPRGKVMGGSSTINYMISTRGNRRDYDRWEAMGNEGWSYEKVLPYFLKLENTTISGLDPKFHGHDGPLTMSYAPFRGPLAEAFVESGRLLDQPIGVDYNGERQIGFSYLQATLLNGTRLSSSRAYLHPIGHRKNLHVKKFSLVTKILIDEDTKTAVGVEFKRKGRRYIVKARKEVIISAGAVNSPQLLMLSGIGPREHLEDKGINVLQDLKVGYNLMDHPGMLGITFLVDRAVTFTMEELLEGGKNLVDFMDRHEGPFSVPAACEGIAFFDSTDPTNPNGDPDLELLFFGASVTSEKIAYKALGFSQEVYDTVYRPVQGIHSWTAVPLVLKPKSRGRIMLQDADPFHHPLIYHDYFQDPHDMEMALLGIRLLLRISQSKGFRKYGSILIDIPLPGCTNFTFNTDDYWRCALKHLTTGIWHLSGTCKMGPASDSGAVVDPRLRVHGINRLRVVDASVMPIIPAAHTNVPTIMVAEKASDLIKEDWANFVNQEDRVSDDLESIDFLRAYFV